MKAWVERRPNIIALRVFNTSGSRIRKALRSFARLSFVGLSWLRTQTLFEASSADSAMVYSKNTVHGSEDPGLMILNLTDAMVMRNIGMDQVGSHPAIMIKVTPWRESEYLEQAIVTGAITEMLLPSRHPPSLQLIAFLCEVSIDVSFRELY